MNCALCGSLLIPANNQKLDQKKATFQVIGATYCSSSKFQTDSHYYSDTRGWNDEEKFEEFVLQNIIVTILHKSKITSFFKMITHYDEDYEKPIKIFESVLSIEEIQRWDRSWVMK